MTPLFSIVIPTYNRSDLVHGAVRSVLAQTFEDFEVVVSDNCSDDETGTVVRGFRDPRVRYVRTPTHWSIANSWEFARAQARGRLVMMLSDDDALVADALARFAAAHRRHEADFLFCDLAEYRDRSFPGGERNSVSCPPFSGAARVVSKDSFLRPLFAFNPLFNMHPSAFVFGTHLADRVAQRCGRFFQTNGVEYFAWPPAAVYARAIVHLDSPLVILGRTHKSWGSTIVLGNPGKEQIQKMIADVQHQRDWIPLTNFTLCNLMAEGMLLGKRTFPDELAPYPFDEQAYLTFTMAELRHRAAIGVDVRAEIGELLAYAGKYPELQARLAAPERDGVFGQYGLLRRLWRRLGLGVVSERVHAVRQARRLRAGRAREGFHVSGNDHGFSDAVECAQFIARIVADVEAREHPAPAWTETHLESTAAATGASGHNAH